MEEQAFQIIHVDWAQYRDQLRGVRYAVFVVEQSVPVELEWDDQDGSAHHVLATDSRGEPIGTGRLLPNGQIGRMAVLKGYRDRGVGAAILQALIQIAKHQKPPLPLFLNAQCKAIPFYSRQGFSPVGESFVEADIPHQRMELD